MYVIEPFLGKVDPTKYIECTLSTEGCVPVPAFDLTVNLFRFQPYTSTQIEHGKVIQRYLSIPSPKNVHVMQINHCSVAEPYFRV